jgi:SAM-dependent methyltransferase
MDLLLQALFCKISSEAPHLKHLFSIFSEEASEGLKWLEPSLKKRYPGDQLLEVGGGLMLLSCQLVRQGFSVTVVEPIAEGFSDFTELQEFILEYANEVDIAPKIITKPIEELNEDSKFDLAFSINVMEHVKDVKKTLDVIIRAIRPGAEYRFTCPNYFFPYEPHFNIPNLFSKRLTNLTFRRRIVTNTRVGDPIGVWNSLNWISVPQVFLITKGIANISITFSRLMFETLFLRAINDSEFSSRRSPWMRYLSHFLVTTNLHKLGRLVPPTLQPTMDCTIVRLVKSNAEKSFNSIQ